MKKLLWNVSYILLCAFPLQKICIYLFNVVFLLCFSCHRSTHVPWFCCSANILWFALHGTCSRNANMPTGTLQGFAKTYMRTRASEPTWWLAALRNNAWVIHPPLHILLSAVIFKPIVLNSVTSSFQKPTTFLDKRGRIALRSKITFTFWNIDLTLLKRLIRHVNFQQARKFDLIQKPAFTSKQKLLENVNRQTLPNLFYDRTGSVVFARAIFSSFKMRILLVSYPWAANTAGK